MARQKEFAASESEAAGPTEEELAAQAIDLPERLSLSLVGPPVGPIPGLGAIAAPAAAPAAVSAAAPAAAAAAAKAPAQSGAETALAADAAQTGAPVG